MPRKPSNTVYVARESFACELDGERLAITAGTTRVREGHPLLAAHGDLFEPLEVHYEVEQATAAPGEKRGDQDKKS